MPPVATTPKNPDRVADGRRGADKRWGDHDTIHVSLEDLSELDRRVVMAVIRQRKEAARAGGAGAASDEEQER